MEHLRQLDLIFTPDKLEGNTLAEDAPMYPVFQQIIEDTKSGAKCWITLREMSIKGLMSNKQSFNISPALLSALLRTSVYRHVTRSLEFLLDMSRLSGARRFTPSCQSCYSTL